MKRRGEEEREKRKEGKEEERGGMLPFRNLLMMVLQQGCLGTSHRNHCHVPLQNFECAKISSDLKLFLGP